MLAKPLLVRTLAAVALSGLSCAGAIAQQAAAPAPSASAPFTARVGADYTPGWDMMTAQEREAYRQRMLSVPTRDECRRMRDEQIKQAAKRANVRGIKELPNPRYDACE